MSWLLGNSGTGKTHIGVALGLAACQQLLDIRRQFIRFREFPYVRVETALRFGASIRPPKGPPMATGLPAPTI
jgi:hypothetical protein